MIAWSFFSILGVAFLVTVFIMFIVDLTLRMIWKFNKNKPIKYRYYLKKYTRRNMYVIEYKIGLFWDHLECSNIIPYISAYYDDSSLESALKFMKKYDTYEKLKAIMIEKEKIIKEKEDEYRNKYKKIYINGKK